MIADRMVALVQGSSVIRAMFEEGKRLAGIYGAENVYDYSLGNPSVAPPKEIEEVSLNTSSRALSQYGFINPTFEKDL